MADEQSTTNRGMIGGNGNRNLAERLREAGAKPVAAMEDRPIDRPMAEILRDWLAGAHEHYRAAGESITRRWARDMLALEEKRVEFMRRALEPLIKP